MRPSCLLLLSIIPCLLTCITQGNTWDTSEVGIQVGQDIPGESENSLDTLEEGGDVGQDIPEESDKYFMKGS